MHQIDITVDAVVWLEDQSSFYTLTDRKFWITEPRSSAKERLQLIIEDNCGRNELPVMQLRAQINIS